MRLNDALGLANLSEGNVLRCRYELSFLACHISAIDDHNDGSRVSASEYRQFRRVDRGARGAGFATDQRYSELRLTRRVSLDRVASIAAESTEQI